MSMEERGTQLREKGKKYKQERHYQQQTNNLGIVSQKGKGKREGGNTKGNKQKEIYINN